MKKISGVIIAILFGIVALFSIAGCGGTDNSAYEKRIAELQSKIEELENRITGMDEENKELNAQIEEMDVQLSERDERIEQLKKELYGPYNEAGGFYERETDGYVSVTIGGLSSVFSYRINVDTDDENLIFLCSVEYGHFVVSGSGKTVELKSGENCHWGFDTFPNSTEYLDIIAKNGDRIIGYGVIELFSPKNTTWGECKVLKFAVFPQVEGEYQTISEDQVKKAIDEVKNESASIDKLHTLQEAYDNGWLTQDDLMSIACCYYDSYKYDENPYAGKYILTEEMSENIATEIKQAYLEQIAKFPEGDRELVNIIYYYGNYNGNIAVSIHSDYICIDPIIDEEFYLGGVLFKNFWQGQILVYHIN